MKLDTHVHTFHSGDATVFPFNHFMRECYNTPQSVYDTAKRRGMDLVTVTDHDQISGALEIAHRPDVLVGCEVTAEFTDVDLCVHLNVLDITPAQHEEFQRLPRLRESRACSRRRALPNDRLPTDGLAMAGFVMIG